MENQIVINTDDAEAHVYYNFVNAKSMRVFLVKVSFPDAGIFINSITVQPNPRAIEKLWVQLPRYFRKGTWVWPVQLDKSKELWPLIERLALDAVASFSDSEQLPRNATDASSGFVRKESRFM